MQRHIQEGPYVLSVKETETERLSDRFLHWTGPIRYTHDTIVQRPVESRFSLPDHLFT